jgi:hypothetical protein
MGGQSFGFFEITKQDTTQLEQHWHGSQETQCGIGLYTMTGHMDLKNLVKRQ